MGKRGPIPQGKLNIVRLTPSPETVGKLPRPPVGMTPRPRNLFKKIVASRPPGTYGPLEIALLRVLCEMENQNYLATQAINKEGTIIDVDTRHGTVPRRNPWFDVKRDSAATMKALSAHLSKLTGGKAPSPPTPKKRKMY